MVVVTGTRLQARRWRFVPFMRASMASAKQAEQAPGFLGGTLLKDKRRAYWTITLWRDRESMSAFRNSGAHEEAMASIQELAEGFVSCTWEQDHHRMPTWPELHDRLQAGGRTLTFDDADPPPLTGPIRTGLTIRLRPRP